ncbi:MAG: hypothetical protein C0623_01410 [Desulfuromonas sp.]|nr:MAG: hypothetical protein C0623_01410 [Desulfuromonas sp.]
MKKIYLIEDEESLRETLSMFLEEFGFEVFAYPSLSEFQEPDIDGDCRSAEESVLFLLDHNLPGERGLDYIAKRLSDGRCQCGGKCMAIMSGGLRAAEAERAEELGCYVFEKPVLFADLEEWLESLGN